MIGEPRCEAAEGGRYVPACRWILTGDRKGLQRSRPLIKRSPGGEHTAAPATVFFENFGSKQSFPDRLANCRG